MWRAEPRAGRRLLARPPPGRSRRRVCSPRGGSTLRYARIRGRCSVAPGGGLTSVGGTTHVSVVDAEETQPLPRHRPAPAPASIVPGTGIYLNNMLGEHDLVGSKPAPPGRRLDEHDGSVDRRRCARPDSSRRRQRRVGTPSRRDHADRRQRPRARPRRSPRQSPRRASTSTNNTSIARAATTRLCSTGSSRSATTSCAGGAEISSSAARRRSRCCPTAPSRLPATQGAAARAWWWASDGADPSSRPRRCDGARRTRNRGRRSEPEGWLLADARWRSVGDERRYIRALFGAIRTRHSSSPTPTASWSDVCRSPAIRIRPARTSPISA